MASAPSAQMAARNGAPARPGHKRSVLTFSEVTDAFVEGKVETERDAWRLAKSRKLDGDCLLWDTLGKEMSVAGLLIKVWNACNCESAPTGATRSKPDAYPQSEKLKPFSGF